MSATELLTKGRSFTSWLDRPIGDETQRDILDLAKFGATSTNSSPARYVFVRSAEAKSKLRPCLAGSNIDPPMAAPANVIVGMDMAIPPG